MQRRRFIKGTIAGTVIALGGGGLWYLSQPQRRLEIDNALAKLEALKGRKLETIGQWNAAQIFNHAAQSIEYSLSGYPQHKSDFFKASVGSLAFSLFASHGSMHHRLDESIPGAPELDPEADTQKALLRLRHALLTFDQYSGELADHFAYGPLSKRDYTLAHVMHLNNHLQEVVAI